MRERVTLACSKCKRKNYDITKNKKTHPEKVELNKYCKFCGERTVHKETK